MTKANPFLSLRVGVPGGTASGCARACARVRVCAGACVYKELCREVMMAHTVACRAETCGTRTRPVTTRSGVGYTQGLEGDGAESLICFRVNPPLCVCDFEAKS